MPLGQIIRKKREQLKLTLDEVSNRIGFSKPYLSTIETSKVKNPPSDELLTKLEKILEFEPGLLLHIAHLESLPADVRLEYESAEAENKKWRQIAKNLIDSKADSNRLTELLAESELNIEQGKEPLVAGQLVPVINKVSAGYPTDFNDLDYPVGIADDYIRRAITIDVPSNSIGHDIFVGTFIGQLNVTRCSGGKWERAQQVPLTVVDLLVDLHTLRAAIIVDCIFGIGGPVCTGFPPGIDIIITGLGDIGCPGGCGKRTWSYQVVKIQRRHLVGGTIVAYKFPMSDHSLSG